jgi:hypothetical protein
MTSGGWIAVALTVVRSGWMLFDGTRALVLGDYVTPRAGPRAVHLGPWAPLVEALGIPARSTAMKLAFVALGAAGLAAAGLFVGKSDLGRAAMIAAAAATLWYLPVGTATSVLVILLLLLG